MPSLDPDVFWIEVEGEVVAVHGRTQVVHLVSATGALLWPYLDGHSSIEALAADVAEAFGIPRAAALSDVVTFVQEMVGAELVRVTSDAAGP